MTKKSDPQELLRRTFSNTTPMQSDERVMQGPQKRSMSGASFQMLHEFAEKAREEGPKRARSSNVPIPEMGLPVNGPVKKPSLKSEEAWALVEDGTPRVLLFLPDDKFCARVLDGTWVDEPRSADEVVMPDELGDFRAASRSKVSTLLQEAAASDTLTPALYCALKGAAS